MIKRRKGVSNVVVAGLVIVIIALAAAYAVVMKKEEGKAIVKLYTIDGTYQVGPNHKQLVEIIHEDLTPENSEITLGDKLKWSGTVRWMGPENENLNTYGESGLGIHLILSKASGADRVNLILFLGNYSPAKGVPIPPGGQYIGHDSKTIPELGGENASNIQSVYFDLAVTYRED